MPAIHGSVTNEEYRVLLKLCEEQGKEPAELVSRYVKEGIEKEKKS